MKTYYDLLSVAPNADADTIKKAFRREIARYHPDKVVHLGPEFQDMAAGRAAELTVAYKTLSDPVVREQYDASLAGFELPPTLPPDPPTPGHAPETSADVVPPVELDGQSETPPQSKRRFETERAGRDQIVKRAIGARIRSVVEALFGTVETPVARGFDLALVPLAKPRFLGSHPPRVLLKVNELVDAASVNEVWTAAGRARVHAGKSPVVVLIFGRQLAPPRELARALDAASRQRRPADGPSELVVIAINSSDWTIHAPDEVSAAIRKLIDRIRS